MARSETSDDSENLSEEIETPKDVYNGRGGNHKRVSEYEKQRMKRIEENRARMGALGLPTMAKSFVGSVQKVKKTSGEKNGKRKFVSDDDDDDDDYKPIEDDELEGLSSSAGEEDDDEDFNKPRKSKAKGRKKTTPKNSSIKKRVPKKSSVGKLDYVNDDDALVQAIWLSLQDSAGFLDVKTQALQRSAAVEDGSSAQNGSSKTIKGGSHIQEDTGKRKRKKTITNRVQMTEDEVIMHFFQFDETGKGNIALRDMKRLAAAHDFMWSDKEMVDMINCFDSDRDGEINLDDFRKIVGRCKMIEIPENSAMGKLS